VEVGSFALLALKQDLLKTLDDLFAFILLILALFTLIFFFFVSFFEPGFMK
jgi:hypothetical protein